VSPDGAYLYEVGPGRILVFARDPSTGLLTRSSCLSADTQSGCDPVTRLVGATSAVLAPDGRQLYVGAGALLLTFARDSATGTLSLAGCAATSPYARDSCAAGEATSYPTIATSPDESILWALSSAGGGALVSFERDASDGTLHKRACASASGRSPCERVRELKGLRDFALAPDGRRLIVAAGQRDFGPDLLTFDVSGGRGPVLQACTSGVPSLRCSESEAIADAGYRVPLAFSPDGRDVYAALGGYHGAGGVFGFGPATGIATRSLAPTGGVAGVKLTCPDELPRDACAGRLAVEPPEFSGVKGLLGHKRYRVTAGSARTVRVHLTRSSVRRLLSRRPTRRVTIVATDDSGTTVASRQAATLRRGR
jgi:DNA-binding beta-propeller fold protein YncE